MTPEKLQALIGLLTFIGYQVAIVFAPHPAEIKSPFWRFVVGLLGRASLLRHQSAPKTFHVPGTRQPWWSDGQLEELAARVTMAEPVSFGCARCRAPAVTDGPLLHSPGCDAIPGRVEVMRGGPAVLLPAFVLLLALLPACTLLTPPRKATSAALKGLAERTGKLKAWSATEEQAIFDSSKTKEEARARVDAHRKAFDYCTEEMVKPSLQDLRGVSKALGADSTGPGGGAP